VSSDEVSTSDSDDDDDALSLRGSVGTLGGEGRRQAASRIRENLVGLVPHKV
jgi:hypothetical protein